MTDIDSIIWLEYRTGCLPACIVEVKKPNEAISIAQTQSLVLMADKLEVPFIQVIHHEPSTFEVIAINGIGAKFADISDILSERDWVGILYATRGRIIPPLIAANLNTAKDVAA